MTSSGNRYADVLLPLPVRGLFTYGIPENLDASVDKWKRVSVQFGRKKIYTAIVVNIHNKKPEGYRTKNILSVIDEQPVINNIQYEFWTWMADYYLCSRGEVMNVALPSGLKLASETTLMIHPGYSGDLSMLDKKELMVIEALTNEKKLTLGEVSRLIELKKAMPLINNLIDKGVVVIEEELRELYKPKSEAWVVLSREYTSEEKLHALFNELEKRAYKQLEVIMEYVRVTGFNGKGHPQPVSVKTLSSKVKNAPAAIAALTGKGILEKQAREISRLESHKALASPEDIDLSEDQQKALDGIREAFNRKDVALFHGVTSSGKTEIYIKLIREMIDAGKQVLYLLPEIALTTQIINRLRKYFGEVVGVYHSRYNPSERVEIWNSVLKGDGFRIVLGPRSALFLPFENLGLIIVDEEHDSSFKQYDPAPRYNARDSAVFLATLHKARALLGTATPSIESYFNAKQGKYALVELFKRYGNIHLPEIRVVDIRRDRRADRMKSHFSVTLMEHIQNALSNREQVILFQNRRGFALRLECDVCNWMPGCSNCDVTLIYHKHENKLRCHYCGFTSHLPKRCISCGSTMVQMRGFGTEKIEEDLAGFIPEARISRMDLDTTRSKHSYQKIISDFENRKIDVLVGTQMVTKGLDFDHVSVVGILNADNMISFPDFRSYERSFQLMLQVSGRAGRKGRRGIVIIQTHNPEHSVIRNVTEHDYQSMYRNQILERRNFRYPPFSRLIRIQMKHKNRELLDKAAGELSSSLRRSFGKRVLGPEYPLVSRIRNLYLKNILIKLEKTQGLNARKEEMITIIEDFHSKPGHKPVTVIIDVDPF